MQHQDIKSIREEAVEYAKNILASEGLRWSPELETLASRYISGEISREAFTADVIAVIQKSLPPSKA